MRSLFDISGGFSTSIPRQSIALFLFPGTEGAREYSETTDRLIDTVAEEIINQQYLIALEILREKKNVLVKAAKLLLKK